MSMEIDPANNDLTLASYEAKVQAYIEGTPPVDEELTSWTDQALSNIPKDGKILELGSGFGRDAEYIQQKGYRIECTDAVESFVTLLQEKGFGARMLNALKDDMGSGYDMVFADAVLLHFTPEETTLVLDKIHTALKDDGIFALRMKKGNGPAWTEEKLGAPRYFYYWQPEELKKLMTSHGFEWLSLSENYTGHNKASWMVIIAKKA